MRYPYAEGSFYTSDKQLLETEIKKYFQNVPITVSNYTDILSLVSPHAGLMYSGQVAAYGYSKLKEKLTHTPTFVLIGPNHTGKGSLLSLSTEDWLTPFGKVENDLELGEEIQKNSEQIDFDDEAHENEHSLEVQLPFIQFLYPNAKIVPICMLNQDLETAEEVANAIFKANKKVKKEIVVVASSDFTHYESSNIASIKDMIAINAIKLIDHKKLIQFVKNKNLSLCGYGPIAAALAYSKLKKANYCEILKHANSGDVTGDYRSVVGYVSAIIAKSK